MCLLLDSQRSHCQQIITSTACCTCIPVTKWCHWYTGELSRHTSLPCSVWHWGAAMPSLEEHGDKGFNSQFWPGCTWSSLRRRCGATPSLLMGSCHFPVVLATWEACLSLLCQTSGGCAFPGCPCPPAAWHGEPSCALFSYPGWEEGQ